MGANQSSTGYARLPPRAGTPSHDKVWEHYYGGRKKRKCPVCGKITMQKDVHPVKKAEGAWQIGHIKPHAEGGTTDISNLAPICWDCNKKSGSMHVIDFAIRQGYKYDSKVITDQRKPEVCCVIC